MCAVNVNNRVAVLPEGEIEIEEHYETLTVTCINSLVNHQLQTIVRNFGKPTGIFWIKNTEMD